MLFLLTTNSNSNHILLCYGVTHLLVLLLITGLNSKVRVWNINISGLSSSLHQLISHVSLYCVKYYLHLWMSLIYLSLLYVYFCMECTVHTLCYCFAQSHSCCICNKIILNLTNAPSFCFKYHLYLFMCLISCHYYMCIICM